MRFFNTIVISASALAALVSGANIQFTDAPQGSIQAGQSFTLKYTGDEDVPATILLRKGPSNALVTVDTITTSATGGSFKWTVPKDIAPGGDYALQITAGKDTNYWQIGAIAGGTAPSSTESASSSISSALSSASSKISSLSSHLSSVTATSSTSAGTTTPTASRNSTTVSSATLTRTSVSSTNSPTGSSTTSGGAAAPSDSNGSGANLKSNAALVLGAVAAMAYLG